MRVRVINRELKYFDPKLYAVKMDDGLIQIYRKGVRWESLDLGKDKLFYSRPNPYYVLSLTHNWAHGGTPVEWGIEPVLHRLREIDTHNHDVLGRIYEENEKRETLRKRAQSNDYKARAYDVRRDFAKAVNDVNTSTMEKVDSRRIKENAYRK